MSLLALLGILLASVAIMIALLIGARRMRPGGWWADPGRAGGVLGAARGPLAVILAFVIFVGFQRFNAADLSSEREATATRTMYKTAEFFGGFDRRQVHANLICYARAVIHLDWPAMQSGGRSERVDDLAASIDNTLQVLRVRTKLQEGALSEMFDEANAREQARNDRLADANNRVPEPVWVVLIAGTLSLLLYTLLFADPKESLFTQAVMVGSVTVVLIGGLVLIWFLSHPFRDEAGSIRPSAMERSLFEMENNPVYSDSGLPSRCDRVGRPLF